MEDLFDFFKGVVLGALIGVGIVAVIWIMEIPLIATCEITSCFSCIFCGEESTTGSDIKALYEGQGIDTLMKVILIGTPILGGLVKIESLMNCIGEIKNGRRQERYDKAEKARKSEEAYRQKQIKELQRVKEECDQLIEECNFAMIGIHSCLGNSGHTIGNCYEEYQIERMEVGCHLEECMQAQQKEEEE